MKNIKSFVMIGLLAPLALAGCRKIETGLTDVTYYAVIDLAGDNPYVMNLGESYEEPGFSATMNGEDITDKISVSGNVDSSTPGIYTVSYTAVNEDGFSSSVSRSVYVLNPGGVENIYNSSTKIGSKSYRVPGFLVTGTDTPGVYKLEDLCGGFYYYGQYPGYEASGYDFHWEALFSVNADNTLTLLSTGDWYFGADAYDTSSFTGTYDPETGVLAYQFATVSVTLTPFQI